MPFDGTELTDAAILRIARDGVANPKQWCQYTLRRGEALCTVGWLLEATDSYDEVCRLQRRYLIPALPWSYRALCLLTGRSAFSINISKFNDAPWRSHAAIVRLFDRAIARAEHHV